MLSREARSRSPPGASSLALQPRAPPQRCSFTDETLVLDGRQLPFIRYALGAKDEIWFPAKPVMTVTGETTITQSLARVPDDCKMSFKDLAAAKGLPADGCYGFTTPPNPGDHNQGKAIWVNESGFYAMLLGSRKPQCASFQRWVLQEVLPSIRRSGGYHANGGGSNSQALQEAAVAMELRLSAAVADAATAAATAAVAAAVAQVQRQHGVLEISRSSGGAQSAQLQLLGTPVDDGQLRLIAIEGGPLYVSEFLREMRVPPELRRRLMPSFAAEAARRKLLQWQAAASEGSAAPPLWTAWSLGAWRHYYTEADRPLLSEVFEDPLTRQQLEELARGPVRARPAAPVVVRRRQGPYARVQQGSSSAVSSQSLRRFFGTAVAAAAA